MKTFGPIDERSQQQLMRCVLAATETNAYEKIALKPEEDMGFAVDYPGIKAALMADHHPGYSMPIGGVLGMEHHVGPGLVGYDIGCGNLYVETRLDADDVDIPKVMDEINTVIAFGVGRRNEEQITDHVVFDRIAASPIGFQRTLLHSAQQQLGTVGSGNHYVDLFRNRLTGKLGIGVHFGSRGFGHRTATAFLAVAQGLPIDTKAKEGEMDAPPLLLDARTPSGQDYIEAMNIALEYAYAGREWVVDRITHGILQTSRAFSVHNNHNEARLEQHGDRLLWVHRKGATPAHPGLQGFVGATMGEDAVIVKGVDSSASVEALYSTVHGAGRVMSRTQAAGKIKTSKQWQCADTLCGYTANAREHRATRRGEGPACPMCGVNPLRLDVQTKIVRVGLINFDQVQKDLREQKIELRGGGADEAPGAYKRLPEVLAYHEGTIAINARLQVLGVAMAGKDVYDPFKD